MEASHKSSPEMLAAATFLESSPDKAKAAKELFESCLKSKERLARGNERSRVKIAKMKLDVIADLPAEEQTKIFMGKRNRGN